MERLIINAALTGIVPQRKDNSNVPLSQQEIVDDAERCVAAGASILHLHIRNEDGSSASSRERNAALFAAVRARCLGVLISGSTSGRVEGAVERRAEVLDAGPDLASLTLGSMNFPTQASVNAPATIRELARRMRARGILPELELFDLGMADYALSPPRGAAATYLEPVVTATYAALADHYEQSLASAVIQAPTRHGSARSGRELP